MIERLISFSLHQRALVALMAVVLVGAGVWSATQLPIDAVPDITPVQVQINTSVSAFAPEEVERLVTYPIEVAMSGLPRIDFMRSLSRYGLSQVTVQFKEGTDIYWARQQTSQRLAEARESLPAEAGSPALGALTSGLGEVYYYAIEPATNSTLTLEDARLAQDWFLKPQLRTVPGVTAVDTIGGYVKQFVIVPNLARLRAYELTLEDLARAIESNNANTGGAFIERNDEQVIVRSVGRAAGADDLAAAVVTMRHGVPIRVRDVAEVGIGHALRSGYAMRNGHETVLGSAIMLLGENSRAVSQRFEKKVYELRDSLPAGLELTPLYARTTLVEQTIRTVATNLFHGGVLVFVVLLLTLGHVRAAIIVALAIPLSMLFAMIGMAQGGVSGNLMSLGAIDFGLLVDGAVVMTENLVRRLSERREQTGRALTAAERQEVAVAACQEMGRPVSYAVAIIVMVYLPILTLQGVEGKMFRPMAITVVMALAGSWLLSLTVVPALASLAVGGRKVRRENIFIRAMAAIYRPTLRFAMRWRWLTLLLAALPLAAALWLFPQLGAVFLPRLEEGSLDVISIKLPSTAMSKAVEIDRQVHTVLGRFPEVTAVFSRAGSGDVTTEPMPVNDSDVYIMLRPKSEWTTAHDTEGLIDAMDHALKAAVPGCGFEFSQPIEDRFNDLMAGIRTDVGVRFFGDDFDTLTRLAATARGIIAATPGAEDVRFDANITAPVLEIRPQREALARFGLTVAQFNSVVESAMAGRTLGQIIEGDKRFDIVLRLADAQRADLDVLRNLPVPTQAKGLRLADVADIAFADSPPSLMRWEGSRYVVVECNVRGRDLESFVEDVQRRIKSGMKLPEGYSVSYSGKFETYLAARLRLMIVVPMALLIIFMLLCAAFGSLRQALLVFTGVPLAVTGGVFALWLREMPFSISAGIGFIALSGVAVLNGVVMVSTFNRLRAQGRAVTDAVTQGSLERLRPVLMTALVASLGFVPMAISTGTGAEVQKPLATVVIGGLLSSTLLTLLVLPMLYAWVVKEEPVEVAAGFSDGNKNS